MRRSWVALVVATACCGPPRGAKDGGTAYDPAPFAPIVWERVVSHETTLQMDIDGAVALPSGIALLAAPALTLHDSDGNELGRSPWPKTGSANWHAYGGLARASGDLVVLFGDGTNFYVTEYAGGDLAEIYTVMVRDGVAGGALAELDGVLHVLTFADELVELRRIEEGAISATVPLAVPAGTRWRPSGLGYPTGDGHLVFCVVQNGTEFPEELAKVIRVNPATGAASELLLAGVGSRYGYYCRLFQGPRNLLAVWTGAWPDSGGHRWALVSSDGDSVVAGPVAVTADSVLPFFISVTHDGTQFVGGGDNRMQVLLQPISDLTGELLPRWQVRLHDGEDMETAEGNVGLAADGANVYVGITPHYPWADLQMRLQKLEPLVPAAGGE